MQENEGHVSRERGARESVHPSAPWTLFTSPMLIPRVFSDIDPNFDAFYKLFFLFFLFFLSISIILVPATLGGARGIRRNSGTFPSVVVVVRRQVVGKKIGERRVGYNGVGLVLS